MPRQLARTYRRGALAGRCDAGRVSVDDEMWKVSVYGHWHRAVMLTVAAAAVVAYLAGTVALFVSGETFGGVCIAVSTVPFAGLLAYRGL